MYLAEYDFRYSNRAALGVDDCSRAEIAAKGISGWRLTYRRPDQKDIPFRGEALSALGGQKAQTKTEIPQISAKNVMNTTRTGTFLEP